MVPANAASRVGIEMGFPTTKRPIELPSPTTLSRVFQFIGRINQVQHCRRICGPEVTVREQLLMFA